MPSYFPEGNEAQPQDSRWRSWQKIASELYNAVGDRGPSYFPEGSQPLPGDTIQRLREKVNAMLQ